MPREAAAFWKKPLNPNDEVLRWAEVGLPRDAPILVYRTQGYVTFGRRGLCRHHSDIEMGELF